MQARVRFGFASVVAGAAAFAVASCSLVTTFDGLGDGGSFVSTLDSGRDAGPIDSGVVDTGASDAGSPVDACTPGVTSCGPVSTAGATTPGSLYQCDSSNTENKIEDCAYGCVMQATAEKPGQTVAVCSPCFIGGFYCGTDKIGTDKNTLYLCNADGTASVKQICTLGCRVEVNGDDKCN